MTNNELFSHRRGSAFFQNLYQFSLLKMSSAICFVLSLLVRLEWLCDAYGIVSDSLLTVDTSKHLFLIASFLQCGSQKHPFNRGGLGKVSKWEQLQKQLLCELAGMGHPSIPSNDWLTHTTNRCVRHLPFVCHLSMLVLFPLTFHSLSSNFCVVVLLFSSTSTSHFASEISHSKLA